jgi:hypothetical protein
MAGFVRRFSSTPTIETLLEVEAVNVIDLAPPSPATGVGTGNTMVLGEFEDGGFAAGGDAPEWVGDPGVIEVFSSQDLINRYGGFGYTYGSVPYNNPSARRHLSEYWNGNGYLKLKYSKSRRLMIGRVDTSVGSVAMSPLAVITGTATSPFNLAVGDTLTFTTSTGGPANSTAITATAATVAGTVFATSGFVGGETISIQIDTNSVINVVFTAADQTPAQVAARINLVLGFTAATSGGGLVTLTGLVQGTSGRVILANVTTGALALIGHTAGTTAGTGSVGNVDAVTATEVATIVNATAALTAIAAAARATSDGRVVVYSTVAGSGTINMTSTAMATVLGITTGTTVKAGEHTGGIIPAGTRVRTSGGLEWVTMQTLTIAAGTNAAPNVGPHVVKVRPGLDDGSVAGAAAAAVSVLVDQPSFAEMRVTNPSALSAALTEPQMDVAYETAYDATLSLTAPTREVNLSVSARRSDAVIRAGRSNAIEASNGGLFGRKFITGAPLGYSLAQARTDVANWRSDRVFYTYPGWQVRIPEIAFRGTAGGAGFTADGIISVRGDMPLATICSQLPPENNPGQQTGLIDSFFQVESVGVNFGISEYIALKAAGICAPRKDRVAGSIYQSGVTSDLTSGRTTIARRKMADFLQDSQATLLIPYIKLPNTQARRDSVRAVLEQFLGSLLSEQNPELARIAAYSIDDVSGNTPATLANGVFVLVERVQTLSSLDAIVLQTQIGEGVVATLEAA